MQHRVVKRDRGALLKITLGRIAMSAPLSADIQKAWNRLLQEVELAKNCHMPYLLNGFGGTFRNPLLDYLLPSLLYVKMAAILDEALVFFLADRGLTLTKKYKKSLHGRIEFLNDQTLLANYSALHGIRDLRNLLAHEVWETTTWENLNADIDTVENELQHLGFVGDRPEYKYFGERSAMREYNEPGIAFVQDFRFGVKCGDCVTMEISFTRKTHNAGD